MPQVTVLLENGRRKNVSVTPHTTILEIITDVCHHYNLNPDEFDLRHHRTILTTSSTVLFSGIPHNAHLELIPVKVPRIESSVILCVQVENGNREQGECNPSNNLWDAICKISPFISCLENPVVIYMRREIVGKESLKQTTLRNIGLTGGRAIIRVLNRTLEELQTQANVSAPLVRLSRNGVEADNEDVGSSHLNLIKEGEVNTVAPIAVAQNESTDSDVSKLNPEDERNTLPTPFLYISNESLKSKLDVSSSTVGEETFAAKEEINVETPYEESNTPSKRHKESVSDPTKVIKENDIRSFNEEFVRIEDLPIICDRVITSDKAKEVAVVLEEESKTFPEETFIENVYHSVKPNSSTIYNSLKIAENENSRFVEVEGKDKKEKDNSLLKEELQIKHRSNSNTSDEVEEVTKDGSLHIVKGDVDKKQLLEGKELLSKDSTASSLKEKEFLGVAKNEKEKLKKINYPQLIHKKRSTSAPSTMILQENTTLPKEKENKKCNGEENRMKRTRKTFDNLERGTGEKYTFKVRRSLDREYTGTIHRKKNTFDKSVKVQNERKEKLIGNENIPITRHKSALSPVENKVGLNISKDAKREEYQEKVSPLRLRRKIAVDQNAEGSNSEKIAKTKENDENEKLHKKNVPPFRRFKKKSLHKTGKGSCISVEGNEKEGLPEKKNYLLGKYLENSSDSDQSLKMIPFKIESTSKQNEGKAELIAKENLLIKRPENPLVLLGRGMKEGLNISKETVLDELQTCSLSKVQADENSSMFIGKSEKNGQFGKEERTWTFRRKSTSYQMIKLPKAEDSKSVAGEKELPSTKRSDSNYVDLGVNFDDDDDDKTAVFISKLSKSKENWNDGNVIKPTKKIDSDFIFKITKDKENCFGESEKVDLQTKNNKKIVPGQAVRFTEEEGNSFKNGSENESNEKKCIPLNINNDSFYENFPARTIKVCKPFKEENVDGKQSFSLSIQKKFNSFQICDSLFKSFQDPLNKSPNAKVITLKEGVIKKRLAGTKMSPIRGRTCVLQCSIGPQKDQIQSTAPLFSRKEAVECEVGTSNMLGVLENATSREGGKVFKILSKKQSKLPRKEVFEPIQVNKSTDFADSLTQPTTLKISVQMEKIPLLDDRSAVVYNMDSIPPTEREDLPDDFFELTTDDIRRLYAASKRALDEIENAPLLTKEQRQLDRNGLILQKLSQYKSCVIRVRLPDRTVLQGCFKPVETIADVIDFIKEYLEDKNLEFYLYTAPPKKMLEPNQRLIEAECVPSAVIYMGLVNCSSSTCYSLRTDVLRKFSTITAATRTASEACWQDKRIATENKKSMVSKQVQSANLPTSSTSVDGRPDVPSHSNKIPKWLKLRK